MLTTLSSVAALVGHACIWVGLVNRLHAVGMPRRPMYRITWTFFALCCGIPPLVLAVWLSGASWDSLFGVFTFSSPGWAFWSSYRIGCYAALTVTCVRLIALRARMRRTRWIVLREERRLLDFRQTPPADASFRPKSSRPGWCSRLPLSEALRLELVEKHVALSALPGGLAAMKISHLSDLHFTGQVPRRFFEEAIDLSNQARPDLVCITGDLVDHPDCIAWLPGTLGRLGAPYGVYFVLGNHDLRVDARRIRSTLVDCGLIDLGARWTQVLVRDTRVVLAGNELPWFRPAADLSDCPVRSGNGDGLRILLSHSPDQLGWARANDFDLMLAGHLHGGQIRLPLVGAVLSPSRYGVKYAQGLFFAPPTVLHVTRGLSSKEPYRWRCPPELALLVLQRKSE